ncbi:hypothetical protein FSPOR_8243 [Fusarium sporotrichioides]|uniref:Uncharacterized protein n=1 Tax=Fusarium sporotrichioides TaxID=5514 RepID=A0A395RUS2_FUSSP|nr:hypothetical protein FSPOR_8243 [Fusarium sporotrichioides]
MAHRQNIDDVFPTTSECTPSDLETEEWWALLAPQKADQTPVPYFRVHSSRVKPSYFCTEYRSFDAFKLLCNSLGGVKIESSPIVLQNSRGHSPLERLPPEILGIVFDCSQSNDFVALSLCSRGLWTYAVKWAQNGYLRWRNAYSLAGTPILYASSRLRTLPQCVYDMYPGSVPTETRQEMSSPSLYSQRRMVTRSTAWYRDIMLKSHQAPFPYDELYIESFDNMITMADIPDHFHASMRSSFPTMTLGKGSKWLLLNMTNNEYIRMESVITTEGEKTVSHPGNDWLTLDILLFWLICWRGDGRQNTWSWEELDEFVGMTEEMIDDTLHDPTYGPLDDKFWPVWTGNWAGHSLEVVTDRDLDRLWVDRTNSIEKLASKMLLTMYGLALAEGSFKARKHWEWVLYQRGDIIDEEQDHDGPDGGTTSTETHKTIVIGSLRVHADCLCDCGSGT